MPCLCPAHRGPQKVVNLMFSLYTPDYQNINCGLANTSHSVEILDWIFKFYPSQSRSSPQTVMSETMCSNSLALRLTSWYFVTRRHGYAGNHICRCLASATCRIDKYFRDLRMHIHKSAKVYWFLKFGPGNRVFYRNISCCHWLQALLCLTHSPITLCRLSSMEAVYRNLRNGSNTVWHSSVSLSFIQDEEVKLHLSSYSIVFSTSEELARTNLCA